MYKKRRNGGQSRVSFQSLTMNKLSQGAGTETKREKTALLSSSLLKGMLKSTAKPLLNDAEKSRVSLANDTSQDLSNQNSASLS